MMCDMLQYIKTRADKLNWRKIRQTISVVTSELYLCEQYDEM